MTLTLAGTVEEFITKLAEMDELGWYCDGDFIVMRSGRVPGPYGRPRKHPRQPELMRLWDPIILRWRTANPDYAGLLDMLHAAMDSYITDKVAGDEYCLPINPRERIRQYLEDPANKNTKTFYDDTLRLIGIIRAKQAEYLRARAKYEKGVAVLPDGTPKLTLQVA